MASLLAFATATPASAAVVFCNVTGNAQPQCANTDTNVLMSSQPNPNLINTNFNGNATVTGTFTSPEALNMGASGQAVVTAVDGVINNLTYNLLNGLSFTTATFNLIGTGNVTIDGFVFGFDSTGDAFTRAISGNGQNFSGITGTAGERFTGFSLTANGLTSFEQLRLAGVQQVASVPEPATWALMLMGFGAVGFSMRRRRATARPMLQMA
jgi:hypothetical protein